MNLIKKTFIIGLLLVSNLCMAGTISKPYTFAPQTAAKSAEVNADFDTVYTVINGNLDTDNLSANSVGSDELVDDSVGTDKIDWGVGATQVLGTPLSYWRIGQGLGNYIDLELPALTGNRTWTLQDSDDYLVGRDTTDTLTNKTLTSPDINGGTIDDTDIGGTYSLGGTVDASLATFSDLGEVTTVDINGGTIDDTNIGGTVDASLATFSDLGTVTTVDINAGTVDATIGGTTPAVGTFTYVYGPPQILSKTLILPEYIQDETSFVPLLSVEASWAPYGITVIESGIKLDANRAYSVNFRDIDWSVLDTDVIAVVATDAGEHEKDSSTLSYNIPVDYGVGVVLPSTTGAKYLNLWFVYTVNGS